MVKKFFSLILMSFILCSCTYNKDLENKVEGGDKLKFSRNDGIVYNEDTARQIADVIFVSSLNKNIQDYKIIDVSFEERNDTWKIVYMIDEKTVGGDITIQISRKNGEMEISFGE